MTNSSWKKLTIVLECLIVLVGLVYLLGGKHMSFFGDVGDFFKIVGSTIVQHKPGERAFEGSHIYNFGVVEENFWRGSEPKELSDYLGLVEHYGIKTVVDLRDSDEEESAQAKKFCDSAGIKLIQLPLKDTEAPTDIQQRELIALLHDIHNNKKNIKPVYLHCAGGRHRSGLAIACYRIMFYDWSYERVKDEMNEYDFYVVFGHKPILDFVKDFDKSWTKMQLIKEPFKKSAK